MSVDTNKVSDVVALRQELNCQSLNLPTLQEECTFKRRSNFVLVPISLRYFCDVEVKMTSRWPEPGAQERGPEGRHRDLGVFHIKVRERMKPQREGVCRQSPGTLLHLDSRR